MPDYNIVPLHADAVGFSAFRGLTNGGSRQYTAVEFDPGYRGAAFWLRRFAILGFVIDSSTNPSYAVLDVLNAEGDIIQDYDIPTAQAFRYIKRMLKLSVAPIPDSATVSD